MPEQINISRSESLRLLDLFLFPFVMFLIVRTQKSPCPLWFKETALFLIRNLSKASIRMNPIPKTIMSKRLKKFTQNICKKYILRMQALLSKWLQCAYTQEGEGGPGHDERCAVYKVAAAMVPRLSGQAMQQITESWWIALVQVSVLGRAPPAPNWLCNFLKKIRKSTKSSTKLNHYADEKPFKPLIELL